MKKQPVTMPTTQSVQNLIDSVADPKRQEESRILVALMQKVTGEHPVIWGKDLIGFRKYSYRYASGHSGESFRVGFSPRKSALSIYLLGINFDDPKDAAMVERLGKLTHGKGCLYVKHLSDINLSELEKCIQIVLERRLTGEL